MLALRAVHIATALRCIILLLLILLFDPIFGQYHGKLLTLLLQWTVNDTCTGTTRPYRHFESFLGTWRGRWCSHLYLVIVKADDHIRSLWLIAPLMVGLCQCPFARLDAYPVV